MRIGGVLAGGLLLERRGHSFSHSFRRIRHVFAGAHARAQAATAPTTHTDDTRPVERRSCVEAATQPAALPPTRPRRPTLTDPAKTHNGPKQGAPSHPPHPKKIHHEPQRQKGAAPRELGRQPHACMHVRDDDDGLRVWEMMVAVAAVVVVLLLLQTRRQAANRRTRCHTTAEGGGDVPHVERAGCEVDAPQHFRRRRRVLRAVVPKLPLEGDVALLCLVGPAGPARGPAGQERTITTNTHAHTHAHAHHVRRATDGAT